MCLNSNFCVFYFSYVTIIWLLYTFIKSTLKKIIRNLKYEYIILIPLKELRKPELRESNT